MALIPCVECGRVVSDRAPACPQCGCPTTSPADTRLAPANRSPDRLPELNVNVAMPPGFGAATVEAVRGAAHSKAWGRLYTTFVVVAQVWLALCAVGSIIAFLTQRSDIQQRIDRLSRGSGFVQVTSVYGNGESVHSETESDAVRDSSERRASAEEIGRQLARDEADLDTEPIGVAGVALASGLVPLGILVGLGRWLRWLRRG
jgi:hypothetical protein